MKTLTINQPVSVTRLGFGRDMRAYPQAIEFDGKFYEFTDRGLSYTVKKGRKTTRLLSLQSDMRQFWLRDDGESMWTLLGMSS